MEKLKLLIKTNNIALYQIENNSNLKLFISSTPESRSICNDPLVFGVNYTDKLKTSCSKTIRTIFDLNQFNLLEKETTTFHILRGGLNFQLREALSSALNWNSHSSSFVSAQRERKDINSEEWEIRETAYQKVYLTKNCSIILGDVVATGTSLEYGLNEILKIAEKQNSEISEIIFFTIGGIKSEEILQEVDKKCRNKYKNFQGITIIYLEGRFAVADTKTPISIKLTGTDLIRRDSLLAPEFITSQSENPCYPLERCTIYDAGSRAFHVSEYLEDVVDYWEQTHQLASNGMSYDQLLAERFPEVELLTKEKNIDLKTLVQSQLKKLTS